MCTISLLRMMTSLIIGRSVAAQIAAGSVSRRRRGTLSPIRWSPLVTSSAILQPVVPNVCRAWIASNRSFARQFRCPDAGLAVAAAVVGAGDHADDVPRCQASCR